MKKKYFCIFMAGIMAASMLAGCGGEKDSQENMTEEEKAAWDEATNDPYGKYPETVTYTTGYNLTNQGADTLKGTAYENDTTEDNAYTRYLKEVLNVQNENQFEALTGPDYDQKVSMAIASQDIPDIMYVSDYATLVDLVENDMVEDMTDIYNNLACDTVKEAYESYGDNNPLNTVTFDGKIMAIPKTQLSDGQDFLWVRKDWMDKLGLSEPHTIDDVVNIVKHFISEDPGNNGEDASGKPNTVGLAVDTDVTGECGYSSEFLLDIIFGRAGV